MATTKRKQRRASRPHEDHGERIARVEEKVYAIEDRFDSIESKVTKMADSLSGIGEAIARVETKLDQSTSNGTPAQIDDTEDAIVVKRSAIRAVFELVSKHKWGAIGGAVTVFLGSHGWAILKAIVGALQQ